MSKQTEPAAPLYAALAKAQQEMTGAAKDSDNPHFRTKYADLGAVQDACLPSLHKHGFAVWQPLVTDETGHWVETILAHESGERISCRIPLILGKHDMQGLGSAITYARRYGLLCMSGVAPEDDDGNKAAEQGHKEPPRRVPPPRKEAPPAEDATPFDDDPGEAEKHEAACLHAIDVILGADGKPGIASLEELKSYWIALGQEQPAVARDSRVISAKDERKAALMKAQKEAAE